RFSVRGLVRLYRRPEPAARRRGLQFDDGLRTTLKSPARNEVYFRNGLPQAEAPPSPPAGPRRPGGEGRVRGADVPGCGFSAGFLSVTHSTYTVHFEPGGRKKLAHVIARSEATKQSRPDVRSAARDCFAALAMRAPRGFIQGQVGR